MFSRDGCFCTLNGDLANMVDYLRVCVFLIPDALSQLL